jgi:hypothetical protein
MRGPLLVTFCLQAGSVVLGHFGGLMVHYPGRPPSVYTALAGLAALLMLGGVLASLAGRPTGNVRHRTGVAVVVLLYSVGVALWDPFLNVHQLAEVVVGALLLLPLLLAIGYLVRGEAWLTVAGVTLFVFTSSAMIASNANVIDAGSGFFGWWTR